MTQDDFDLHFQLYLSNALTAPQTAALRNALQDPRWQQRWRELSDLEGMLAGELSIETAPQQNQPNITNHRRATETPRRTRARKSQATPWMWLLAAAAAVVLALVGLNFSAQPTPSPVAELQNVTGEFQLIRSGKNHAAKNGAPLFNGDTFQAPKGARATLQYADGTTLTFFSDTQLQAALAAPNSAAETKGKQLTLTSGSLDASVSPQASAAPLLIHTPTAQVKVLGTRFTLHASQTSVRLDVQTGRVRMQKVATGEAVEVSGGFFAIAAPDQTLIAKPAAPATAPLQLFDAQLSTWTVTHGKWTFEKGIVKGAGEPGKFGRIESTVTYVGGELVCKLRVTGVPFAEVQFGGYRELFPLHWDVLGDWKELRVRADGQKITGTLNGKPLELSKTGGDEKPAGVLSFYTPTGAALEIKDAQWFPDTRQP